MPHKHIDQILGPERNPRQGFGAADILRWTERWTVRPGVRAAGGSPAPQPASTGMDEFFARVPRAGAAG